MAKRKTASDLNDDLIVVGIGASAGGITALQSLLRALPAQPNVALVVVQHLQPGEPTRLIGLVSHWTPMSVHPATDGVRPQRNSVYIAAGDEALTLERGALRACAVEDRKTRPGIDT